MQFAFKTKIEKQKKLKCVLKATLKRFLNRFAVKQTKNKLRDTATHACFNAHVGQSSSCNKVQMRLKNVAKQMNE